MTRKWSEVVTQEAFINLSPEERNQAQAAYFKEVIAPQVPIQDVNQVKEEFYSEYPEATSGLLGAVGSSVDRLQAGAYQLMGNQEAAEDNLRESRSYVPSVRSYKDIGNIKDLGEYVGEGLAQGLPYMAMLAANPLAATAGAAGLTALEAGATYAEQTDKNVGNAIASATANTLLERIGLTGANTFLRKGLQETITESGIGGAQHLVTNMIGHGQSFDQARQNIDEAIMGSAIQRASVKAASKVPDAITNTTQLARDNIPVLDEALTKREDTKAEKAADIQWDRDVLANKSGIEALHQIHTYALDKDYAANKDVDVVTQEWQRVNEPNTINAMHRLRDNGASLTPMALDITVRRYADGTETKYNLAEQYGLKGKASADKLAKNVTEVATAPLIGEIVDKYTTNPRKNYAQSQDALTKMKTELDKQLNQANLSESVVKEIDKYVSNKGTGELSKTAITEVMDKQGMQLLNTISEQKQAFKMVDNMKVKDETLESVAKGTASTLGADLVFTGGLATLTSTLASAGSRLITSKGRKEIDNLLSGIEPTQRESVIKAILGNIDPDKLGKMGIENEYELEGEE